MHLDHYSTSAMNATDCQMTKAIVPFCHVKILKLGSVDEFHVSVWQPTNCFLGVNEPLTFTHYPKKKATRTACWEREHDFYYRSLCSAAHQWGYIAAHVQLTQDRWSKFTSNQWREWNNGEGSLHLPVRPPRLHCHWYMLQFDMFDQVTPCECIHFEIEMNAREYLQHPLCVL